MKRGGVGKFASVAFAVFALSAMTVGVIYAPTLYRMFCAATGYGGATQRALKPAPDAGTSGKTLTVRFDSNVAPGLDWEFRPEQREVQVEIGVPKQVYYYARNLSDETVVGRATFNVTPDKAGLYFFKIECFCFTNEKLAPGQSARMPILFYVDDQFTKDLDTRDLSAITLSYTFFKQDASDEEIAAARNLAEGSKQEIAQQEKGGAGNFTVEVRRK